MAEHLLCKERVRSSSLLVSTISASYSTHLDPDRSTAPCPSTEGHRPADRWRGSIRRDLGVPRDRTLPTGYVNRLEMESLLIFDFAVLSKKLSRSPIVDDHWVSGWKGSSYTGHEVDALAPRADEGRGRLRKAPGSREQTLYPEISEWGNPAGEIQSLLVEPNRPGGGKPAN